MFCRSIVNSIAMTDFYLYLGSAAMTNIVINNIQEDFEFVLGYEGYKFPRVMAEFLSSSLRLSFRRPIDHRRYC
jgi:hypothetical protein